MRERQNIDYLRFHLETQDFFIRYYEKHCGGSHAAGAQSPQERSIALQKK